MTLLLEFLGFFAFIGVLGYLLPAGSFYLRYHVRQSEANERLRIQNRRPAKGQVAREIKLSLVTIAIFAAMSTVLLQCYKAGWTSIYLRFRDYPLWYLPVSVFLCLAIHDTYFYWTHRLMHWRPLFKYTHLGHHRSVSPTPWAIYAFQPAEAIIQFLGICGLVLFLPLHPVALLVFLGIDTQINTAGHNGYEVVPQWLSKRWFFQGINTVTHHDNHHTNFTKNFGAFFNVWDRLMGTFLEDSPPSGAEKASGTAERDESPKILKFQSPRGNDEAAA